LIFFKKSATVAAIKLLQNATTMADQPHYVEGNIFVDLGLANLPEEQKLALLDQMNELIHKRTMLRVLEILTDEQKQHLMKDENQSEEALLAALQQVVPNLGELIFEQVELVKNEVKASLMPE
jgi:hypothetical protein